MQIEDFIVNCFALEKWVVLIQDEGIWKYRRQERGAKAKAIKDAQHLNGFYNYNIFRYKACPLSKAEKLTGEKFDDYEWLDD